MARPGLGPRQVSRQRPRQRQRTGAPRRRRIIREGRRPPPNHSDHVVENESSSTGNGDNDNGRAEVDDIHHEDNYHTRSIFTPGRAVALETATNDSDAVQNLQQHQIIDNVNDSSGDESEYFEEVYIDPNRNQFNALADEESSSNSSESEAESETIAAPEQNDLESIVDSESDDDE